MIRSFRTEKNVRNEPKLRIDIHTTSSKQRVPKIHRTQVNQGKSTTPKLDVRAVSNVSYLLQQYISLFVGNIS